MPEHPGPDGRIGTSRAGGSTPIAVLVLVKGLGMGGAERLLVDQALVSPPDVAITVARVRSDKTHHVADLEAAGIGTIDLGDGLGWPLRLACVLRQRRPDIVHSHSPLPAAIARTLVRLGLAGARAHHVSTEHNRWNSHRLGTRLANTLTLALDSATWSVSEEARQSIRPARLRRRVTTLHHGIAAERVRSEASGAVPTPSDDAITFVQVANRRPNKAHENGLRAFAVACRTAPDIRLQLVGQWLDTPEFTALVDAHPNRDRIEIVGADQQASHRIATADVLFLSSDHEGLPVVIMEALALGKPTVATAVGGIPEAIRHEIEGLLAPARDPEALGAAMSRIATDSALRTRLGAASHERARSFDASVAQQLQNDTYRRLRGRRRTRFRRARDRQDRNGIGPTESGPNAPDPARSPEG